jgi:hypothetical protein
MHKSNSKIARVLRKLKEEGTVTNAELNKICFRYSAYIHLLRKEGHYITTRQVTSSGLYEFIYHGEANATK